MYVCVHKGLVLARLSPLRAFGGLKWQEFAGTSAGENLLTLLADEFCPRGAVWMRVSDYGGVGPEAPQGTVNGATLYETAEHLEDLALHPQFRERAVDLGLTNAATLKVCDDMLPAARGFRASTGASMRSLDPPELPLAISDSVTTGETAKGPS